MSKFVEPWRNCSICKQEYQRELALDIASSFVIFVERHCGEDRAMQLAAYNLKLGALSYVSVETGLNPKQREDSKHLASRILSMIRQRKTEHIVEASIYENLGRVTLSEGTKESAKAALGYFEKCRDIYKAIGHFAGVTTAEGCIAIAKYKYEGEISINNDHEWLKQCSHLYVTYLERLGIEAKETINAGVTLAIVLKKALHGIEPQRLITRLVPLTKRINGPDHLVTQRANLVHKICKKRVVSIVKGGHECFQALRYEEGGTKCVVQGPIAKPHRNINDEKIFSVASSDIFIESMGTPIVCLGLVISSNLNGKIGDVKSADRIHDTYEVHFEDQELKQSLIKRENTRILFEIPEK